MKKILFLMTVVAAIFSCTNNDVDELSPILQDQIIGFSTLRDKATTRDANDTKSNFQVYANLVGNEYWYIKDIFASEPTTDEVGESTTDKIYYWPGNEKLNFYAFAPDTTALGTSVVTATAGATPSVSIQYVVPTTGDQDFSQILYQCLHKVRAQQMSNISSYNSNNVMIEALLVSRICTWKTRTVKKLQV